VVLIKKKDNITRLIIVSLLIVSFGIGSIGYLLLYHDNEQGNTIERILLFSIDSSNPEYLSPTYMPKLYGLLKEQGIIYKNAWASVAAETMNGHTSMLSGCYPNSTGVLGNGVHIDGLSAADQPENPVQDPQYRFVNTIFEDIQSKPIAEQKTTGFVSGKWRLPAFLSQQADFVFASPTSKLPVAPAQYIPLVGTPITVADGDIIDQWVMTALTELVLRDDPEFVFVNLAWPDAIGHDTGSMNENHARQLRSTDDVLAQFMIDLKRMGKYKSTLFIFTSDHGMDSINDLFYISTFLRESGISVKHVHAEGQSAFVFLTNPSDSAAAVAALRGNQKVALVLNRTEMPQLNLDTDYNRTGDIYVSAKENIMMAIGDYGFAQIGTHGGVSCRDVPMAFMGPTIKKGEFIQETIPNIADIVPTIYSIWGGSYLPIPTYMDGGVINGIFE
jgi:predicted AlkP superfamily pyrophosphatase or phosphodiesterase